MKKVKAKELKEKVEKEIFIKISIGDKVESFIHLPFTKNYKEIILKWLKKQKRI